jgi:signal peptidase I
MEDDQSMPDRAVGRTGLDDQSADGPRPGAPETAPPGPEPAAGSAAGDPAGGKAAGRHRPLWAELVVLVSVALVTALVIKTFVIQAFFIPSSSMEDTLLPGDKVVVNKIVFHLRPIQPGDIVVFDGAGSWDPSPRPAASSSDPVVRAYRVTLDPLFRSIAGLFGTAPGQTDYVKRVLGVPGDRVACCNAQGRVTVNGVPLRERSYLYPGAAPSEIHFSIVVPRGRLWVMGDNRLVSDDSRLHRDDPGTGTIPENKVIGRAFMIVWPPSRWTILQVPATFKQHGVTAAAATAGMITTTAGGAPYLPLAGGVLVAVPITWLQRRVRLRRRRARR